MLLAAGRLTEANALFDQTIGKVPPGLDLWTRSAVLTSRSVIAWRLRRIPLALELAAEGWTDLEAEAPRGPAAAQTLGMLGYMLEGIGHRRAALDVLRLSVKVARASGHAAVTGHCLQRLGGTLNFRAFDGRSRRGSR